MASLSDALEVMSSGISGATLRAGAVNPGTRAVLEVPSPATTAALWLTNRRGRSPAAFTTEGSSAGDDIN